MNSTRPLADPRLVSLLTNLLSEEQLPPLDRWFSRFAKKSGWSVDEQKRLWDGLRRALSRAYGLLASASTPEATSWAGFRTAMRGRGHEWAVRADFPVFTSWSLPSAGIPGWLGAEWNARVSRSGWSEATETVFLAAQERPAPVHVRFRGGDGDPCRERLVRESVLEPSDVEGIDQLSGGSGLEGGDDWKKGVVEIQDAASQLSLKRLELRPGMRVWDVCAGRGGKTLLAARELRGKGALVASDVSEAKLTSLKDRVRRSGWQNIRLLSWDGSTTPEFGREIAGRGGFDRVIVDAPCSASGTWRRDPEGRFRLTPRVLKELSKHQQRLIRLGWEALKAGGRLAYITCSWFPSENEEIVDDFVAETGAVEVHRELLGLPLFDANTLFVSVLEKAR